MNQIEEKEIITESKRIFLKHRWLNVYVKKSAFVPYEPSIFKKIILDSKDKRFKHRKYVLYIHEDYLTIRSNTHLFEPVKVPIDDKLWVELYCVFNLSNNCSEIIEDNDDEPI